jgi:hypothetical protein
MWMSFPSQRIRLRPLPRRYKEVFVTAQISGFRKSTRAGAMVFAILPHGRLGPTAIGFGQLLFS